MVMLCIDMLRFRDAALFKSWAWAFDTNSEARANLIGHTADPGAAIPRRSGTTMSVSIPKLIHQTWNTRSS